MKWEVVIGLEIHAQLSTKTKIFSAASTAYGAPPNTQACAVDLGLPGVLPVLNQEAVRMAIKFGLAIGAQIAPKSVFARKNYFYPDLPKGYQISQYELPIVSTGYVDIEVAGHTKRIGITRAHLEEDAGKSLHEDFQGMSGIDLNRAGTPLIEIVSEPDLRSAQEAVAYMKKLHALVRYLEICDGNMQEGSFRCDANVSVRPQGEEKFGTRTELKNLNSFRFVEKAIEYEVERQIELIENGGQVVDPDLLPVWVDEAFLAQVRATLPELPEAKKQRFMQQYALPAYDAEFLTASRELADYFEALTAQTPSEAKLCANWVMVDLSGALNKAGLDITQSPVSPSMLGAMLRRISDNTISGKIAKEVFEAIWNGEGDADTLIASKGLQQVTDNGEIEKIIDQVLAANPKPLAEYRAGKEKLFGFFVGQVMKLSKGKANPQQVNELLNAKLRDVS